MQARRDRHAHPVILMPAKSEEQRNLMAMVLSVKRGEKKMSEIPEAVRADVKRMARGMTDATLREFVTKPRPHKQRGSQPHLRRARMA